ncbi:MAG: hypothetical protein AB7N80_01295 [Bdellovibrionales bacterium]
MKPSLLTSVFALGLLVFIVGCSDTEFSSTSSASAKSVQEGQPTVEEIVDDGEIDPEEGELLDRAECGLNRRDKKVNICHVPSGNIANSHTLCVSRNALAAHIGRHGEGDDVDYIGKCLKDHARECNEEDPEAEEEAGNQ